MVHLPFSAFLFFSHPNRTQTCLGTLILASTCLQNTVQRSWCPESREMGSESEPRFRVHARAQWCHDPMDCRPPGDPLDCKQPGSSVLGILQARILERVAIYYSSEPSPFDEKSGPAPAGRSQFAQLPGASCPGTVFSPVL